MRHGVLVTASLALLLGAVPAVPTPAQERPPGEEEEPRPAARETADLSGRVVFRATRTPVPGAEVFLLVQGRRALTDTEGRFWIEGVETGLEVVQVRLLGELAPPDTVEIPAGVRIHAELEAPGQVHSLEELTVRVRRKRTLREQKRAQFEREARALGSDYLDREDLERIDPHHLSDAIPYVTLPNRRLGDDLVLPGGRPPPTIYGRSGGARRAGAFGCTPGLYVNDMAWKNADQYTLDEIPPERVVGLVTYRSPFVPVRYRPEAGKCGVIAVWVEQGRGSSARR